jgi:MraZ protein
MLTELRGERYHRIDDKFRLSIPREFVEILRKTAAGKVVLTRGFERSLWLYPFSEYNLLADRLAKLPQFKKDTMQLRTLHVGSIYESELDKQGRIIIPKYLLTYAGIEQEVVIVGELFRLQIWSLPRWTQYMEYLNTHADEITEGMSTMLEPQSAMNGLSVTEKSEEGLSEQS